jgi:hypothetical protein
MIPATSRYWLSLWGRTIASSEIVELCKPRKFLPPGTFCQTQISHQRNENIKESYNIRSVTLDLPADILPFILYLVQLSDSDKAISASQVCRRLVLPAGGINLNLDSDETNTSLLIRFPVGSLLLRQQNSVDLFDRALVASPTLRFTATGWVRRTFHYDDPSRLFAPSAIVYRDSSDAIIYVEEFNHAGDAINTERFALQ